MRRTTLAVLGAVCALAAVGPGAGSALAACSNEAIRVEQGSTALPECRAYEMVSPPDKSGSDIQQQSFYTQSAKVGEAVAYGSTGAFAGALSLPLSSTYVASRSAGGWTTTPIDPLQSRITDFSPGYGVQAFSPDLKQSVQRVGDPQPVPGAEPNGNHLVVRMADGSYRLLTSKATAYASDTLLCGGAFAGASNDFSHVVFETSNKLTDDATIDSPNCEHGTRTDGTTNLYEALGEAREPTLRLVDVLPDGEPAPYGGIAGGIERLGMSGGNGATESAYAQDQHVVSEDGSRIFWSSIGAPRSELSHELPEQQVYVRIDGRQTVEVSASQRTIPDTPREAEFVYATPDGHYAFFLSAAKLTNDSTATYDESAPNGEDIGQRDLYRYDVDTRELRDLTVDAKEPANVKGILGVSDDGQTVYFAANGFLTASSEGVPDSDSSAPIFRRPKIYVSLHGGSQVRYITTLAGAREAQEPMPRRLWEANTKTGFFPKTSRVTADGRYLIFEAALPETAGPPPDFAEIYRFDALSDAEGSPTCVSCASAGVPMTASPLFAEKFTGEFGSVGGSVRKPYMPNFALPSGRALFATNQPLVPADVNEKWDVYLWVPGSGPQLISTGTSPFDSFVGDASPDGTNVYFLTRQRLVAQDTDANVDLYDARIDGGFPEPPPPPQPCSGEGCQGSAGTAPSPGATGSAALDGFGNVRPGKPKKVHCGKGKRKVTRNGKAKCVKKQAHKKRQGHEPHQKQPKHSTRAHG